MNSITEARQRRALITRQTAPRKQYLQMSAYRLMFVAVMSIPAVGFVACDPNLEDPHGSGDEAASSPASVHQSEGGSGNPVQPTSADEPSQEGPRTVDSDVMFASMGEEQVTREEIDRAIRMRALLGGLPVQQLAPDDWERDPYFVRGVAEEILQQRHLLREGRRLRLMPDLDRLIDSWQQHSDLAMYFAEDLDAVEVELQDVIGLGVEDIYAQLRAEIVRERWLDLVVSRIPEEQLLDEYLWRNSTVTVESIAIPNAPSDQELRQFLADASGRDLVESEYQQHPGRYTQRPSADARFVRVRVAEDASEAIEAQARSRIEALRAQVMAGTPMDDLELVDGGDPPSESTGERLRVVALQLPIVFQLSIDEVGPIERDQWGFVFYRLERRYPAEPRPFDEILQREIGSNYLARHRHQAQPSAIAAQVLEAMQAGDESLLSQLSERHAISRGVVGPFRREDDHLVAGIGRSEPLAEAVFSLVEPGQAVSEPLLVESNLIVARLVERQDPTAEDFDADRDGFRAEFAQIIRATAWDAFWAERLRAEPLTLEIPVEPPTNSGSRP